MSFNLTREARMIQKSVSAKVPEKKDSEGNITQVEASATIVVNYSESLNEAIEMYGEEAILTNAFSNWRVTLQANVRNSLKTGMEEGQIQSKLNDAKMGVAATGGKVDAEAAFIAKFKTATPDQQAEMLAKLREAAQD